MPENLLVSDGYIVEKIIGITTHTVASPIAWLILAINETEKNSTASEVNAASPNKIVEDTIKFKPPIIVVFRPIFKAKFPTKGHAIVYANG